MDWHTPANERFRRASIDGRAAFGIAILLSGTGLLALMDRIGVPEGLVRALAVLFVLTGLITIAALLRTMRVSAFYAAGRAIPSPYAGLAMASLGAALFLPFVGQLPQGTSLSGLFSGFACGMAFAALVTGPLLRKSGAFSIPDLIAARFPKLIARLGTIVLTAVVAILIGLAAYQEALSALTTLSGLSRPLVSLIIACILAFVILPGGLASTLWIAVAAAIMTLTGFGLPLLISAIKGGAFPFTGSPGIWGTALGPLETWTGPAQTGLQQGGFQFDIPVIASSAFGLGALAPLLCPSIACRDRRTAQRAGFAALGWGGVLILLAIAALAQASVSGPTNSTHLLTRFAALSGTGAVFSGLAAAALLALSLALAATAIQCAATVLGNDMFYRVRDTSALTSRRLAITRAFALAILTLIGFGLSFATVSPQTMTGFAIVLSAAGLAPLLILTLWPQATSVDAAITLLTGLLTAEALTFFSPATSSLDWFAVSALISGATGLAAGMLASLSRPQPAREGHAFTRAILNDAGEWLHPDKGA